jgi:hypothetical protein
MPNQGAVKLNPVSVNPIKAMAAAVLVGVTAAAIAIPLLMESAGVL